MLPVLKSLPVCHEVHRADALPAFAAAYRQDTVTLGWEERVRTRARRQSDSGFEFATALARGTVLHEGDCFVFPDAFRVVRVTERPEAVFVVVPRTPAEGALFAYHIGNSHQPLMLDGDVLVCAETPGMEQVLVYHGIPYERAIRAFTPLGRTSDHRHSVER